jgi:D-hydroxyproline dehydrogenase subunit gamma
MRLSNAGLNDAACSVSMRLAIPLQVAREMMNGRLMRAVAPGGPSVHILVDGAEVTAYAGESVLVAVLAVRNALRRHEFGDEMRAGFCLMGACQDCWIWLADGGRVRACTTVVAEGMSVVTNAPSGLAAP